LSDTRGADEAADCVLPAANLPDGVIYSRITRIFRHCAGLALTDLSRIR
jgi:hypothetical protein